MAILNSKQIKLADGLINEMGYRLKEFNNSNTLKLQRGQTIIYLQPRKR